MLGCQGSRVQELIFGAGVLGCYGVRELMFGAVVIGC